MCQGGMGEGIAYEAQDTNPHAYASILRQLKEQSFNSPQCLCLHEPMCAGQDAADHKIVKPMSCI